MSLLDKLWDDTVAGPRPESGLGKLRKHPTFGFRSNPGKESDGGSTEEALKVTRRIMIVKPPTENGSPPVSPAGSTPPVSPFAGGGEASRFRRRSLSDVYEKANRLGPRSPRPPYDV
ncbi:hypothetical protein RHGRI_014470 [Rhododendron griersonianum]|uniref:Dormancy/auxin associated family protein n=1 Tax=Rhododendron griersonianum TaxID=479676 RepID=A0AAV6K9E4_9ERIC|nr:hypothetical protein RHGRI_014470 [Rhododendron griersonianum]